MVRLEGGQKFLELAVEGETLSERQGRIGTDGKHTQVKLGSSEAAVAEHEKRLGVAKKKRGWKVVSPELAEPLNAELERAIMEDPSDAGRLLVYADWLQAQGHPRGELAALQHVRAGRKDDAALSSAEEKLLAKHPELAPARFIALVGKPKPRGATDAAVSSATWENGFIASARVARGSLTPPYTVREIVAELLTHPAARFLRELRLGPLHPTAAGATFDYSEVLGEIVRARPRALRTLAMVDLAPGSAELAFADLGDLSPLFMHLPYLEELRLAGRSMTLGELALPALKRLRIGLSDPSLFSTIARAKLPVLEELHLECGDASVEPKDFAALAGLAAPKLESLTLARTGNTDALVAQLAHMKLLFRLRTLSLAGGRLTDAGAAGLAQALARPDKALAVLDVSGNALTKKGAKQLAGLCAKSVVEPQRQAAGVQLSDQQLAAFAPDAGALAKGRVVAKSNRWPKLGREGQLYWGICQGSDRYEVYLRLPELDDGCTCPSGKRPCKHAIALALLVSNGHAFDQAPAPKGLVSRASSARYSSNWE
jgi:uncharacterized protein (TIGR02996 family)